MSASLCNQATEAWYWHNFHVLQNSFAFSQSYENVETALGNIHMEWLRWGGGRGVKKLAVFQFWLCSNPCSTQCSHQIKAFVLQLSKERSGSREGVYKLECLTPIFNLGWKSHEVSMSSSPSAYGGQDRLVILALSWHPGHLACQLLLTPGHQDPINKTKVAWTSHFQPSSPRTDPYPVNQLLSRPHFPRPLL